MEQIYETTICQFERIEQSDLTKKYIKDENSVRNIFTIYDNDKMVDIETGKQYPILKREKDTLYLDKNQEIIIGDDYVSNIQKCSNSILENKNMLLLYLKAIQMRRKLTIQREFESKVKVKK